MASECRQGEDTGRHQMAPETPVSKKCGPKAVVPACAAVTTAVESTMPSAPAAANAMRFIFTKAFFRYAPLSDPGRPHRGSPDCDNREIMATYDAGQSSSPVTNFTGFPHRLVSHAAQITIGTVPDIDVSFRVGGLCYLQHSNGERDFDRDATPHIGS